MTTRNTYLPLTFAAILLFCPAISSAAGYDISPFPSNGNTTTLPWGINNRGDIVGYYYTTGIPSRNARAFLWSDGVFQDVAVPGSGRSFAYGINDRGDIAGLVTAPEYPTQDQAGFLTMREESLQLGRLTQQVSINGINNHLDLVVQQSNPSRAFLLDRSSSKETPIAFPGALGTRPNGVNDRGDVVGVFFTAAGVFPFLLDRTGYHQLDIPGGTAYGINNRGQIVGSSPQGGFVWYRGAITFINPLQVLTGINDRGEFVGIGSPGLGTLQGYTGSLKP
jgi:probable HAF family extracellular repeat protein